LDQNSSSDRSDRRPEDWLPLGGSAEDQRMPADEEPEIRGPVDLRLVDHDEAKALLEIPLKLASAVVDDVDAYIFHQLAEAVIDMMLGVESKAGDPIIQRIADEGLNVKRLTTLSRTGRGRLHEHVDGDWHTLAELVIRGIAAVAGRLVLYEQLSSERVEVGRRHHGIGTDKCGDRLPNTLRMLVLGAGMRDRMYPISTRPLLTGTRDDHSSSRADLSRIETWGRQLGRPPPGPLAEHVQEVLADEESAWLLARNAVLDRPELFSRELSKQRLADTFARPLLMGEMPYGPIEREYRERTSCLLPGKYPEVAEAVASAGRRGVLFSGSSNLRPGDADFRFEFAPLAVGRLPRTYELGITLSASATYFYSAKYQQLARAVVGKGVRLDLWQLVGYDDGRLLEAVGLIERYLQATWTKACMKRWNDDCAPGLLKAHNPVMCAAYLDLLNVANAAVVEAHRQQARRAFN
jgi:hypothetical protein